MNSETVDRVKGVVSQMKHLTDELDSLMHDLGIETSDRDDEAPDPYIIVRDQMHNRIDKYLMAISNSERYVCYSAYKSDEDEIPIDNLSNTAFLGKGIVVEEKDEFFGSGRNYQSDVLDTPSFLDLALVANELIETTGDFHHAFFESVMKTNGEKVIDGELIPVYKLSMGS